jgi:hypothetical protein
VTRMSWILPVPLHFAGVVALLPLSSLVRHRVSPPHQVAEAVGITLAVIALVWLAWWRSR